MQIGTRVALRASEQDMNNNQENPERQAQRTRDENVPEADARQNEGPTSKNGKWRVWHIFAALGAGTLVFACVAILSVPVVFGRNRRRSSRTDAMTLRSASELYAASGDMACPTVETLMAARVLNGSTRYKDAWGRDFVIECHGREFTVISPGPDGRIHTEDDIRTD